MAVFSYPFELEWISIFSPRSTWSTVLTERASCGRHRGGDPLPPCGSVSRSEIPTFFGGLRMTRLAGQPPFTNQKASFSPISFGRAEERLASRSSAFSCPPTPD